MKLCVILPPNYFPFPLVSGGSQAVFNMIDKLRFNIDISLVFAYKRNELKNVERLKQLWNNVEFLGFKNSIFAYKKYPEKIANSILNKIFKKSILGIEEVNPAYMDFFCEILAKNKFDIIQTEFFPALQYIYALRPHSKTIFVNHEIRYVRNKRLVENKALFDNEIFLLQKVKSEEIAAMNTYNAVITLSDIDKGILQRDGVQVPVYSSPAFIKKQAEYDENWSFQNKIVFLASGNHTPNRQGLEWFMENVWNKIKLKYPHIKFCVIGNWDKVLSKKYRDINFLGFVPNLKEVLQGAVMVVPLLSGSGMRIKILDGINYGCPIVTTSVGVEGLDFRDGEDLIIEDVPEKFSQKLCRLISNENEQRRLRKNAKGTMDKLYSESVLTKRRLNVYREVLK